MKTIIDKIIAIEKEMADEFQNTVDTHMVSSGRSLEELYCDDTEVIEENLKRCKELSDYHNTIANTMSKYQKIEQILKDILYGGDAYTKDDVVTMLKELKSEFEEEKRSTEHLHYDDLENAESYNTGIDNCIDSIQTRIDKLIGGENGD